MAEREEAAPPPRRRTCPSCADPPGQAAGAPGGGKDPFQITKYEVNNDSADIKANFDALEGTRCPSPAASCPSGAWARLSFCDLQDKSGRIQLYARQDEMDEAEYDRFKKFDIGDIVGVKGEVFRTQRGEMSVRAETVTLLTKSLLPLPEKFHGLTDTETALPPAVRGPDRQPGGEAHLRDPLPVHQARAGLPGRPGLHGGGDPRPEHHLRRRHRPALHHPPQHPGHRHVHAHRHRAAPEAAHRGRHGPGV